MFSALEEKIEKLYNENIQLKNLLKLKDMKIFDLQLSLKCENLKNTIYTNIIKTQTDINLENFYKEQENEIHIYNHINGNIPVIIQDFIEKEKPERYVVKIKKKNEQKDNQESKGNNQDNQENQKIKEIKESKEIKEIKESKENQEGKDEIFKEKHKKFRTVKDTLLSEEELSKTLKNNCDKVEKELDKIIYEKFDVSTKEINNNIEEFFIQLQNNNRTYITDISYLKKNRSKLLGKLNIKEYIDLLLSHIKKFIKIERYENI